MRDAAEIPAGQLAEIMAGIARIEALLCEKRSKAARTWYSLRQASEQTKAAGLRAYSAFTLGQACRAGRVPQSKQQSNGRWVLPHSAVELICEHGLPSPNK